MPMNANECQGWQSPLVWLLSSSREQPIKVNNSRLDPIDADSARRLPIHARRLLLFIHPPLSPYIVVSVNLSDHNKF